MGGEGEELKFNQWVTYVSGEPCCYPIRYFTMGSHPADCKWRGNPFPCGGLIWALHCIPGYSDAAPCLANITNHCKHISFCFSVSVWNRTKTKVSLSHKVPQNVSWVPLGWSAVPWQRSTAFSYFLVLWYLFTSSQAI